MVEGSRCGVWRGEGGLMAATRQKKGSGGGKGRGKGRGETGPGD